MWATLQTAGHPFPLLLGQSSSALLSTAQAGGPPSVEIGWVTKTIIFENVRGHKMTSFFTYNFFGQFAVLGIFFSPTLLVKMIGNSPRKIGAKVDSCKLTVLVYWWKLVQKLKDFARNNRNL